MKLSSVILSVLAGLVLMTSPAIAQEMVDWEIVAKIREEGFNRSQVNEYTSYLSDVIGSRLTGSPNMRAAQQWCKRKWMK